MGAIRFGTVTRGDGRVFVQLLAPDGESGAWLAEAALPTGEPAPSKVVRTAEGDAVLVVPVLDVDLRLRAEHGGDEAEMTLSQKTAKRLSQLNTLLKNEDAARIRNCDRVWRADEARIGDLRIVPGDDPTYVPFDTLRFFVTQRVDVWPAPDYEVHAVGRDGRALELAPAALLGECTYASPDYPGVTHRRAAYGLRIPAGERDFTVWVRNLADPARSTFDAMWEGRADSLRDDWRRRALPAEYDGAYEGWFQAHKATARDLRMQRRAQANFKIRPTFSLVVPLYHTPIAFLREMAASALGQTYPKLELVLVNSTPDDFELRAAVSELASVDSRVRVVELERNLGITENTNAGIDAAAGDFVAFFDHDDLIEPDLLYWYVEGLNRYPETDLLYCDEDKLEDGRHSFPFFKPDWDPVFLETNNYVCHLLCVRRSLLAELSRPDAALDGAQDHSLTLAAGERARNVYHARRVLYHWRIHEGSTAGRTDVKTESIDAGRLALERHFERIGVAAAVEPVERLPHCYRLAPRATGAAPSADVIAGGRDVRDIAAAAARSTADYLVFLDPAASMREGCLERLLFWAGRPGVGAAAPKVVLPDGSVRGMGIISSELSIAFPILSGFPGGFAGPRGIGALAHQVTAVREDCLVVPRAAYEQVGGIPEGCHGMFWSLALCMALREAGFMVLVDPEAEAVAPLGETDLSGNALDMDFVWRTGECELLARFPREHVYPDHFYSDHLGQDGFYGIER